MLNSFCYYLHVTYEETEAERRDYLPQALCLQDSGKVL